MSAAGHPTNTGRTHKATRRAESTILNYTVNNVYYSRQEAYWLTQRPFWYGLFRYLLVQEIDKQDFSPRGCVCCHLSVAGSARC